MTHDREVIKRPETPPVCQKCGSHRTQIIGTSKDRTVVTVRCGACGAVTTAPALDAAAAATTTERADDKSTLPWFDAFQHA